MNLQVSPTNLHCLITILKSGSSGTASSSPLVTNVSAKATAVYRVQGMNRVWWPGESAL